MHELMSAELAPAPYLVGFFFLSFTVLCVFLVVNLFVSVVVVAVQKNEEEAWAYKQANDTGDHGTNSTGSCSLPHRLPYTISTCQVLAGDAELDWSHLDGYMLAWAAIDKTGAGVMKTDDELRELLGNLPEPLKCEAVDDQALQQIAGAQHIQTPCVCLPSTRHFDG
jgi:hypothetical protein